MENIITRLFVTFPVNTVILALHLTIVMPLLMAEWNIGKNATYPCYAYDCISSIYSHIHHSYLIEFLNCPPGCTIWTGIIAQHSPIGTSDKKTVFRVKLRQPNSKKAKNYHDIYYRKNPIQVMTNSTGIRVLPLVLSDFCVGFLT